MPPLLLQNTQIPLPPRPAQAPGLARRPRILNANQLSLFALSRQNNFPSPSALPPKNLQPPI